MVYIEIPPNMEYRAAGALDMNGEPLLEDTLVSLDGSKSDISIQQAVNEFYKTFHRKSDVCGRVNDLDIYKKIQVTPYKNLLEYTPENNGKIPTTRQVRIFSASSNSPQSVSSAPHYGRWINHTLLSPERREVALEKEKEQRENRRKSGDSPFAN